MINRWQADDTNHYLKTRLNDSRIMSNIMLRNASTHKVAEKIRLHLQRCLNNSK